MIDSSLLKTISGFVNGKWCGADSGATFKVSNPADGSLLACVPEMLAAETTRAIECAERRLRMITPVAERARWLTAIGDAIIGQREELGRIITLEHGKPLGESKAEADYAASFFRFYASQLGQLEDRLLAQQPRQHAWHVCSRPAGVVALICPWNFPIAMLAKKLSAALAAGCNCVVKPSSKTPLTTIALFSILEQMGLPPGVANLIIGPASVFSETVCSDSRVRVISFTGSTQVGRSLMRQSAGQLKRLSLELGGNAPFIVFEDADLVSAADHLIQNKFRAGGQTCVCANRIYIQRSVEADFIDLIKERVIRLNVGDGQREGTDIGPLIDRAAFEKVKLHLEDAVRKGARVVVGEAQPVIPENNFGFYFKPVVLRGIAPHMLCVQDETFGPLLPIACFDTEHEVVAAANATEYGLAAYVFTADLERGKRVIEGLRFGHVGFNSGTGPAAEAPFGGFKQSGFGREGGIEGLHDFIEYQTVAVPL